MFIANGKKDYQLKNAKKQNFYILSQRFLVYRRKKWIISSLNSSGKIYVDVGAAKALSNGKSLLAAGITK